MRKWFTPGNVLFVLLLGFIIATQAPTIISNFKKQGEKLRVVDAKVINSSKEFQTTRFPPRGHKAVAIFWTTTCAPCKLEMARLKSSVEQGKISEESLFAINPFESSSVIKKFLARNDFPFTFIEDTGIAQDLNVQGTPTTIFIDKGEVVSMKTGVSLTGIWSAEAFLDN